MFARVLRRAAASRRGRLPDSLTAAKHYVATDEVSGKLQFALLQREGCLPSSTVMEVGCGCLNAGVPLIEYLNPGHYAGIDPNEWLLEAAMRRRRVRRLVASKRPMFLNRGDFDAGELGLTFDYVLSHSVLSHCAHWQLEQFVGNIARALRPRGRILASIRLAEGNAYGSSGTPDKEDSMDEVWQYPGVSWFKLATVKKTAQRHGLNAVLKPEYTELYIAQRPKEMHDWIVFS
jgi:SAM-dependent methyltransferase